MGSGTLRPSRALDSRPLEVEQKPTDSVNNRGFPVYCIRESPCLMFFKKGVVHHITNHHKYYGNFVIRKVTFIKNHTKGFTASDAKRFIPMTNSVKMANVLNIPEKNLNRYQRKIIFSDYPNIRLL